MAKLYNLAAMTVASTGTGTITLGSPATINGVLYLSFAAAGTSNGDVVAYSINDVGGSEAGTGTYTASGTTLTRTPITSTNSNAAINMTAAAIVRISPAKADIANLREQNTFTDATGSSSTSTGSATFAGGVGIAGNLNVGGVFYSGPVSTSVWGGFNRFGYNGASGTGMEFIDTSVSPAAPAVGFTLNSTPIGNIAMTSTGLTFNAYLGKTLTLQSANANAAVFDTSQNALFVASVKSSSASGGMGYATGAGGSITQITSRNTGVTLSTISGDIVLLAGINAAVSAATANTVIVTNTTVAVTDTPIVTQKSGTDKYLIFVTNVSASAFSITFFTTGGTTNESPVFHFNVIKGVNS